MGRSRCSGSTEIRTLTAWDEAVTNDTTFMTLSNPGALNGVGFIAGLFRETQNTDRVFYSYYDDAGTDYDYTSNHHVRQIRSGSDMAGGTQTAGYFQRCSTTGGTDMTCGSTLDLRSARQLSFAWLDFASGTDRTVTTWINQDNSTNGNGSDANRVMVSVGMVDDDTIPEPDELPDFTSPTYSGRSSVGPAVACKENYSGSQDCILAWVPIDDTSNTIRVVRFSVAPPAGAVHRYVATFETTVRSLPASSQTANSLTAWWNGTTSRFYVAYRSSLDDQEINVARSSDGSTWASEATGLDTTHTPPSAAGTWTGANNLLVYLK